MFISFMKKCVIRISNKIASFICGLLTLNFLCFRNVMQIMLHNRNKLSSKRKKVSEIC